MSSILENSILALFLLEVIPVIAIAILCVLFVRRRRSLRREEVTLREHLRTYREAVPGEAEKPQR